MQKVKLLLAISLLLSASYGSAEPDSGAVVSLRRQAVLFEQARGVKRNYSEAYKLYCRAALQDDAEANYNLGWMYFNGRGVKYDMGLAMGWFRRAAERGDRYGKNMVRRFPDVLAKQDHNCTLPKPIVAGVKDRKRIESWVRIIAPHFKMDPKLVMAVIDTESSFNPKARSPKNAQGLMQLIPETAKRFGVSDPWDPIENIIGGTAYLHWLTRHFSGDLKLVLAGYNAGEGAVEKYHGVPPYQETQLYVKRITGQYRKTAHPVPIDLGELKDYAVEIMKKYSFESRSTNHSSI
ncbi:MAG: transglycosylase SLT domain-containing protein [Methylococcaceae bacterium]|nr:transglycosylase SLT domain-containing protein [Methylococcaceae bacterium]MCI0668352.1 transglycosylase SLT domain-containing protein [Methylococcaceae bacterium]MCI0733142.1 transglycosylase SLT domain-containing protein [Methylococcaceae bacterium]